MIRTETKEGLIRTYSDAGLRIRQEGTGAVYDEAVDPVGSGRAYSETDELIDDAATPEDLLAILTGGAK